MPGVFYCDPQHMRTCLQLCSHLHDPRSLRTFLVPLNLWCLLYSIRSGRPRRKLGLFSRKPWLGISEENSLGSRGTRTRRAAREREREQLLQRLAICCLTLLPLSPPVPCRPACPCCTWSHHPRSCRAPKASVYLLLQAAQASGHSLTGVAPIYVACLFITYSKIKQIKCMALRRFLTVVIMWS